VCVNNLPNIVIRRPYFTLRYRLNDKTFKRVNPVCGRFAHFISSAFREGASRRVAVRRGWSPTRRAGDVNEADCAVTCR